VRKADEDEDESWPGSYLAAPLRGLCAGAFSSDMAASLWDEITPHHEVLPAI
jgi:hypothetical protein